MAPKTKAPEQNTNLSNRDFADLIIKKTNDEKEGAILRLSDGVIGTEATEFISTQAPSLDLAIGKPGIPVGKVTSIVGEEKSGKSTLCQHLIAECQEQGGMAYLLDSEAAFDTGRASSIGVKLDELNMMGSETIEEAFTDLRATLDSIIEVNPPFVSLIIFDSVSSLPTEAETKKDADESAGVGTHARAISRGFRGIPKKLAKARCALVLVSQDRAAITMYGNKKTYIGEGSIKYQTILKIRVQDSGKIFSPDKKETDPIGIKSHFKCELNKTASPYREAMVDNYFIGGFDSVQSEFDVLCKLGHIEKAGAWYKYNGSSFHASDWKEKREEWPELLELVKSGKPNQN